MKIRPAAEADLPGIFAIYDAEVLHGTATFDTEPKSAAARLEWFRNDGNGRYPLLVAEADGQIAGWARLYAWSPRPAYDRTAENAVYVHADFRGRGVSRALMTELMRQAPGRGVQVLIARIVEGNPASLALHQSLGFESIGVMRRVGEKFGRLLDVHLMCRHLDSDSPGAGAPSIGLLIGVGVVAALVTGTVTAIVSLSPGFGLVLGSIVGLLSVLVTSERFSLLPWRRRPRR